MSARNKNTSDSKDIPAKKKSISKRILKIFLYFFGSVILLLVAIIILLQTTFFKNLILDIALDKVNEAFAEKDSRFFAESLEGNIFKGIRLKNAGVIVKQDTMIHFDELDVNYSLTPLLHNYVDAKSVVLINPTINFTKIPTSADTLWNIAYLFKSEPKPEDTTKSKFNWKISAQNVEIVNLNFRMLDFKPQPVPIRQIAMLTMDSLNLNHLDVKNLNLKLSGFYSVDEKNVNIEYLKFHTNTVLDSVYLSMNAAIDKDTKLKDFTLMTGRSNGKIFKADIYNYNVLDGFDFDEFQKRDVDVSLNFNKFDFADLTFFLSGLDFIDGRYYLALDAAGKYTDMDIKNLNLATEGTNINIKGKMKDLNVPENLFFDVKMSNSDIDATTLKDYLPGLPIPDFSKVGKVSADAEFVGRINNFNAKFNIATSNAGSANGNASIDLTQAELVYSGNVNAKNVNPGLIIGSDELKGNISGNFRFDGRGTDYKNMNVKLNYSLSNTSIFGYNISSSDGTVNLNNGNAELNLKYSGDAGSISVAGNVTFRDLSNVSCNIQGYCNNFNIAALTKNSEQTSNLNFIYDIRGTDMDIQNFNPDRLNSQIKLDVEKSTYGRYEIHKMPISIDIRSTQEKKYLNITSDIADAEINGNFSYRTLPEVIISNISDIAEKADRRIKSSGDTTTVKNEYKVYSFTDLDMTYKINVKDFETIKMLSNGALDSLMDFRGSISGYISNKQNHFSFISNAFINTFVYRDSLIRLKDASMNLFVNNNIEDKDISAFRGYADFYATKIFASGMKIDSVNAVLDLKESANKFSVFAKVDTSVRRIKTDGTILFDGDRITAYFDTLYFDYRNLVLNNPEKLIVKYVPVDSLNDSTNLYFDNFRLINKSQGIEVGGRYSVNGNSDLQLRASKINIDGILAMFMTNTPGRRRTMVSGNIRRLNVNFIGTLKEPDLDIEMNTDLISMNRIPLGRADAMIKYKNNIMTPDINLSNTNNEGSLRLTGEVPFKNPVDRKDIDSASFLKSNVNLDLIADNFQMKVLEQFIPVISGVDAKLNSKINITGNVENPILKGNMSIDNGQFLLLTTGVTHKINSKINAEDSKLLLDYLRIYNIYDDTRFFTLGGYVDLKGLTLNDVDINITGDCMVLDNKVTNNTLGIYGDLLVGSGRNNLKIRGNQDKMELTGDVVLKKGKLYIPPFQRDAYSLYRDNINYKVFIDSSKYNVDSVKALYATFVDTVRAKRNYVLDAFDYSLARKSDSTRGRANLKKNNYFFYNLNVTSEDDIYFRYVIDDRTKMEVFGEVSANLYVKNDNVEGKPDVRGIVDVKENSTFKFYKNFKASGKVTFNGDYANPIINLTGLYSSTEAASSESQSAREVDIYLYITGTITKMELKWKINIDGSPMASNDPTGDAMSFIIFGRFTSQLNASQRMDLVSSVGANVGTAYLSNYVSSFIQNIMPFILSTDINYVDSYGGNVAKSTDIRITAGLGDFKIQVGGQVLSDITNTNFIIEYPLSKLFGWQRISNNLLMRFERLVDPFTQNALISLNNRIGGALIYKIKF